MGNWAILSDLFREADNPPESGVESGREERAFNDIGVIDPDAPYDSITIC